MGPREEGTIHPAMPPGILAEGQRKSEEILLATDRPQTNDRCETQMRLGEVISQAGVTRIKEDVNPATRTGGKFQSLNQKATTIKRCIHVMQRQWLQNGTSEQILLKIS